jgi:hypothetical protein
MPSSGSAARRIQRAYRLFRAKFPAEGRIGSRSSSEQLMFQEDSRLNETLAQGFASLLVRHARMEPEDRVELMRDEVAERRETVRPAALAGMVRAVVNRNGGLGFTGGMQLARWAYDGFGIAAERLGEEDRWRLADLQRWEVDALAVKFQLEEVAERAAPLVRGGRQPRIVRTAKERRPVAPKPGYDPMRHVVPLDEDAILRGEAGDLRLVGAPGDAFKLRRDAARFLGHALGGFEHYAWRLNPRRRRRKAGRPQRWIMHANYGLIGSAKYRILRALAGWAGRVDAARGWRYIFARPVDTGLSADKLRVAARALVRHLRRAPGGLPPARTGSRSSGSSGGLDESLSGGRSSGRLPRAFSMVSSSPAARSSSLPDAPLAVGSFSDGEHFGGFVARLDRGARLSVGIFDPHAKPTFDPAAREAFEAALRREAPDLVLAVAYVELPLALRLQYRHEGSCGPSSLAIMLSLCRLLAGGGRGAKEGARPRSLPPHADDDLFRRAFSSVTDEDVVLAVQLAHGAVV